MYLTMFFLHILGIAGIAAPILVYLAAGLMGSNADKGMLAGVYRLGDVSGRYLATFGGVVALITGLIMVAIGNSPDVAWGKLWIWVSIVLFVISAGMTSTITSRASAAAAALLAKGDPGYKAAASRYGSYVLVHAALWVIIVALMVYKPF